MRLTKLIHKNETHKKSTKIKLTKNPQKMRLTKIHKNETHKNNPQKRYTKMRLTKMIPPKKHKNYPQIYFWKQ